MYKNKKALHFYELCLNGSQVFVLGTAVTLRVCVGPPSRLVCRHLIESSVWRYGCMGRLQTTYFGRSFQVVVWRFIFRFSFYTCVQGMCVLGAIVDPSGWKNSPLHNNPSVRDKVEEVLPMADFCFGASEL